MDATKYISAPNLVHSLDKMDRIAIMNITDTKPSLIVRIWPDGTSVLKEYYNELGFAHMSDDYIDVDLYDFEQMGKARAMGIDMNAIIEEYIGEDPIIEHG